MSRKFPLIAAMLAVLASVFFITPSAPIAAAEQPSITIYNANLQHGTYTDGSFNYAGQANILAPGTDIVTAQEISTGDLPNWDAGFAANGMTRAIYFRNSTLNDGNAIWFRNSTVTLLGTYTHQLSSGFISWDGSTDVDKSAVAVKVSVGGKVFYVVTTHLCWSRCADVEKSEYSVQRVAQINELLSWINSNFTDADVIISGDMNFAPDYPRLPDPSLQIDLFSSSYDDMWQTGLSGGKAFAPWGDRDGNGEDDMPLGSLTTRTADKRRIDYFFLKKNAANLSLNSITVPDLRAPCPQALVAGACPNVLQRWGFSEDMGVRPSDHNWLKAVFTISDLTAEPVPTPTPTLTPTPTAVPTPEPTPTPTPEPTVIPTPTPTPSPEPTVVPTPTPTPTPTPEPTVVPTPTPSPTPTAVPTPEPTPTPTPSPVPTPTPTPTPVPTPVPTPTPTPVPSAPSNLSGTAVSTTQIRLNWQDSANNETGYMVERCKGVGCTSFVQIATLSANTTTFTNSGLNKNNAYRYRLRAYNSSGNSAYSNIVELKTLSK